MSTHTTRPDHLQPKMWRLPRDLVAAIAEYRHVSRSSHERDAVVALLQAGLRSEQEAMAQKEPAA